MGLILAGPLDRTIRVRCAGLVDPLAPATEPRDERWPMCDPFAGDTYSDYMRNAAAPQGLGFAAADSPRLAGILTDELGVKTVRVLWLFSLAKSE